MTYALANLLWIYSYDIKCATSIVVSSIADENKSLYQHIHMGE